MYHSYNQQGTAFKKVNYVKNFFDVFIYYIPSVDKICLVCKVEFMHWDAFIVLTYD